MRKVLAAVLGAPIAFVIVFLLLLSSAGTGSSGTSGYCASTATGKLSAPQVAAIAYAVGWRGSDLVIATAITEPESGADTTAVQQGQPLATTGWGLFQVTPCSQKCLDPMTNARMAFAKYQAAHGFTPWTTYTGGEYLAWMAWAAAGVAHMSTAGLSCQAGLTASSAQSDVIGGQAGQLVVQGTPPGLPGTFEGFPWGQCTYWVALHFPVTWHGDAWQWWANAAAAGAPETQTPTVGSVVVYGPGGGYSSLGHVAYVVAVTSAGFVVSEMNYVGVGIVDERTSTMQDVDGFIL